MNIEKENYKIIVEKLYCTNLYSYTIIIIAISIFINGEYYTYTQYFASGSRMNGTATCSLDGLIAIH